MYQAQINIRVSMKIGTWLYCRPEEGQYNQVPIVT